MKSAIVIGGTGMVGKALIKLLVADARFGNIHVYGRRSTGISSPKIREQLIDFNKPDSWQELVRGDILFSTLGTTLKQAGGKQAQYKIDHTYQFQFAQAAAFNEVPTYVLVSSASASPDSRLFYSRMKGELERDVKKLPFRSINILQPSLLHGSREQERFGEKLGYGVLNGLNAIGLFRKYRAIEAGTVAQAMINVGLQATNGVHTYKLDEIFNLAI
jgi:uncharacterized protein YbjT (DUF2867 family)